MVILNIIAHKFRQVGVMAFLSMSYGSTILQHVGRKHTLIFSATCGSVAGLMIRTI